MMRIVLSVLVLGLVVTGAIVLIPVIGADGPDVSSAVPLAEDALLILVEEYYYDFDRQYDTLQQGQALRPGVCASRILFETDREPCVAAWASRRYDFTTDSSHGFLLYMVMETDYHAHLFLNETLTRILDPYESIPVVRWSTTGLAGFSDYEIGRDVDELLAVVIRTEEGYIHLLIQRMGRVVLVTFEEGPNPIIQRKFGSATTYRDHFRIIAGLEDARSR